VVWAVHSADILSCATAAKDIRYVQRAYDGRVSAMALTSARDSAVIASFLRSERLGGLPRRHLTDREFRRETGGETTPTVYVVRNGKVVARMGVDRQTLLSGRGADRLESTLAALLAQPN
jgi:hypothetical protein